MPQLLPVQPTGQSNARPKCAKAIDSRRPAAISCFIGMLLGMILWVTGASPSKADDSDTYTIAPTYTTGETNRYKMQMKLLYSKAGSETASKPSLIMTLIMSEHVDSAGTGGALTLTEKFEKVTANDSGRTTDMTEVFPLVTIQRDASGKMDVKTTGGDDKMAAQMAPIMQSFLDSQTMMLPKTSVKVGDKWTFSVKNPLTSLLPTAGATDSSGAPIKADSTVTGTASLADVEMLNGLKVLRIRFTDETTVSIAPGMVARGEGSGLFRPDIGRVLSFSGKSVTNVQGVRLVIYVDLALQSGEPQPSSAPIVK